MNLGGLQRRKLSAPPVFIQGAPFSNLLFPLCLGPSLPRQANRSRMRAKRSRYRMTEASGTLEPSEARLKPVVHGKAESAPIWQSGSDWVSDGFSQENKPDLTNHKDNKKSCLRLVRRATSDKLSEAVARVQVQARHSQERIRLDCTGSHNSNK